MKGYYTVELQGELLSRHERIRLETLYVQVVEEILGGREAATALCLAAAAENEKAAQALRHAHAQAEATLHKAGGLDGVHFALRAWQAQDLE